MDILLKNILKIKESNNLTDRDFAKKIGLYPSVVSEWKNNKSKSYIKYLPKIADCFNVSVDYLLGKMDTKKNSPQSEEFKREYEESSDYVKLAFQVLNNFDEQKQKEALEILDFLTGEDEQKRKQGLDILRLLKQDNQ